MTLVLAPLKEYPILVFIVGLVVCDIVEFATSYIMEKAFPRTLVGLLKQMA